MKKVILIVVSLLVVAAILFITLRKKPNETITTPAVDSSQVYKTKKDSVYKEYMGADSFYSAPITNDERAELRARIRESIARQRDSLRKIEENARPASNGL